METTGPEWDGDGKGLETRLEPLPVVHFSLLILLYSVLNDYLDYVFETKKATIRRTAISQPATTTTTTPVLRRTGARQSRRVSFFS